MKNQLEHLSRSSLSRRCTEDKEDGYFHPWSHLEYEKLSFVEFDGLFDIRYFGGGRPDDNEIFGDLLNLLVANPCLVRSLHLAGPDEGANGLKEWRLEPLADCGQAFVQLIDFQVQLYELGDHNIPVLGAVDQDEKNLATLLNLLGKLPNLLTLSIPEVPGAGFEEVLSRHLRVLRVQAVNDHRSFIKSLAALPLDFSLDFTDTVFIEKTGAPDLPATFGKPTPFQDYQALMGHKRLPSRWHWKLRESSLTKSQLFELQNTNRDVQFLHIPTKRERYISHWMKEEGNW